MAISTSCFFIIVAVIVILLLLTTRKEKFISRIPLRHLTETEREHYTSTNSTTGEIIVNGAPGILLDQGYQAINITTSDIVFYGGSSSNTERMRLQGTTGNVGIGTNNPGNPLTVIGAASISGSTTTGSLTSAGAVSGASLSVSGTSLMTGNLGIGTATASNPLTVYGNSYVSGTSQLMGNVGIGMAPATYPLNVSGDINCSGSFRVNGTALSGSGSSTLWTTSGSNMYTSGNLGIGTNATSYTLNFAGAPGINAPVGYNWYVGGTQVGYFDSNGGSNLGKDWRISSNTGNLYLNNSSTQNTIVYGNIYPNSDSTSTCGKSGNMWVNIWGQTLNSSNNVLNFIARPTTGSSYFQYFVTSSTFAALGQGSGVIFNAEFTGSTSGSNEMGALQFLCNNSSLAGSSYLALKLNNGTTGTYTYFVPTDAVGGMNIYPGANNLVNLGISGNQWANVYTTNMTATGTSYFGIAQASSWYVNNTGVSQITCYGNVNLYRNRLCFSSAINDWNHSIYNDGFNNDNEGYFDGLKYNGYNGHWFRVGNAALGTVPTTAMYINSSGNIGIQTTSIGYTLDINGNFHAQTGVYVGSSGSPGYITMMPTASATYCGFTEFRNGVNRCGYMGYGTNIGGEMCLDLHAENGWGMDLWTNGHNIFFYTDGGTTPKIQIGTVGCLINGGSGLIPALTINGSDRLSGLAINANRAGILVNSTGAGGQSWNIWSVLNGEGPTAGSLAFYNQTNNNFGMVLTQAGNLGLGTNTPGSRLSISGTGGNMSSLTNTTTNAMYQQWNSPGGNASIGMDGSAGTGLFGSGTAYSFDIGTSSATPICFFTNNTGPRMTIDTNGNTTSYGWMINQKSCYGVYYPGYAYFYNNSNVYYGNYAPTGVYSYCIYSGYAQAGYTNNISSVYPWITVQMSGIYTLTWIAGGSIPTGVELFISVAQGNGNELNTGTAGYWGGGIVATFMSYGNAEATLSWTGYIGVNTNIRFGCYNGSGSNWYPTNNPYRNAMCIATNVIAGF